MTDTETQTEMYEQTQAFPKTPLEIADEFLEHFQGDVESAEKSLINARVKLAAAQILRDDAEENLRRERIAAGVATVEEIALDMKRSAEAAGMGLSFQVNGEEPIVITEAPAVDPITGEVASKIPVTDEEKRDELESEMDAERGEPLPALDPTTAEGLEAITGEVRVIYPGERYAHITDVGSRTQYGELVADYLATLPAVSPHRDDPVAYYCVMGIDDGLNRDLRDPVAPDDYGVELAVVRRVDVQEANELLEDAVR